MTGPAGRPRVIRLVIRREVSERLRAKSFLISTAIYLLVAIASVVVPRFVDEDKTIYGIGVAGPQAAAMEEAIGQLAPTFNVDVRLVRLPDRDAAVAAVRNGSVAVAVVDANRLVARSGVPDTLGVLLDTASSQVRVVERLGTAGIGPAQAASLLATEPLALERIEQPKPVRDSNRPLAFAGVLVIYLLLLTYGFTVANGVLEEKSSRVSEILLGALRPAQLLAGKVIGIGIVALVQLLAIALPTSAIALALGSFSIPDGTLTTLAAVLLWALLGYGLYSCVFAAAGAAASRPEDVGNATAPITILIAATYFVAMATVQEPDGSLARIVSFIPPMAPMTMLPRAAVGHVAWWEVPVSAALVLLMTYVTVRLGGRIYAGGIRRPGPKLKLREAWKAASG